MNTNALSVLGFGDNIVDRFVDRNIEYPGGNCVNVAVFARQLGLHAAYLGVFGDDELGTFVRGAIEDCGVDTSRSSVRSGPTGFTNITTIDGDRHFLDWNNGGVTAVDPIRLDDEDLGYVSVFSLVHSSAYSHTVVELPKLNNTPVLRSYDFSSEEEFRTDDYLHAVGPWIDLALLSCADDTDAEIYAELKRVATFGPTLVLATRGLAGAIVFDGDQFHHSQSAPIPGDLIDTMGCGDAYLAGFVVELMNSGWKRDAHPDEVAIQRAMSEAAKVAAAQCTVGGAFGHGRTVDEDSESTLSGMQE
jgi:sugar/nucleoside kinase (ribokinase family)